MHWDAIAPMVVLSTLFLSASAVFILRGPLGRAFAERIARRVVAVLAVAETQRHVFADRHWARRLNASANFSLQRRALFHQPLRNGCFSA